MLERHKGRTVYLISLVHHRTANKRTVERTVLVHGDASVWFCLSVPAFSRIVMRFEICLLITYILITVGRTRSQLDGQTQAKTECVEKG